MIFMCTVPAAMGYLLYVLLQGTAERLIILCLKTCYTGYCVKAGWQAHSSSMLLLFLVLCMFLFLCCSCVHVTLSFVFIYPWANAEVNVTSSVELPVTSIQYLHGGVLFLDSYSYLLCHQWTDESVCDLFDFSNMITDTVFLHSDG